MKSYFRALVLAAVLTGHTKAAPAATRGTGTSTAKSSQAPRRLSGPARVLPDSQIEHNIRMRLARSKMSGREHFTVTVQGGVATLEGKTDVIQHKGVATRLAKLGGAVAVKNQIRISEEAKAKAAARLARNRARGSGSGSAGPVRARVIPAR